MAQRTTTTRKIASRLLPSHRIREIAELAEAVFEQHSFSGNLDLQSLIAHLAITISFGHYQSAFDGMLEQQQGRFHIFCNLDRVGPQDSPRARFTLAHELGHYYIDDHRNTLLAGAAPAHRSHCDYESPNLAEQEADLFAANLLMPQGPFAKAAKRVSSGFAGIMDLAKRFGTSLTSTAIRYAACNISPCAVITWNHPGYAWKWLSSDTFAARFRRTIEAPERLPQDCPTAHALADESPPPQGFFQAATTAAAWFPRVKPTDYRNIIFIEQAFTLGRFGVLTFLYPESGNYGH